nr:MAG TPA: hypothetical protein [Caudoviricetes sp.]DAM08837.1 MAG TPA: hypothetical protein [Caudoviricetes sp.]DAT63405.1 MAG TPA: hypothetical protein [Caudoviricetes sp.]DAW38995.1 MAG TPA: hypothetical protein [Caudoviricetes sp.]
MVEGLVFCTLCTFYNTRKFSTCQDIFLVFF